MGRGEFAKPSLQALSDSRRRALIQQETEEHEQRQAAVAQRLESFPNLKNYMANNPAVGGKIWSNFYIIQRLHDDPQVMPALNSNPEVEVQNLIMQYTDRYDPNCNCVVL